MIVSPLLLAELERVLRRPKFATSIDRAQVGGLVTGLMEDGLVEDPPADPGLTPDPGDDYLVALARACKLRGFFVGANGDGMGLGGPFSHILPTRRPRRP